MDCTRLVQVSFAFLVSVLAVEGVPFCTRHLSPRRLPVWNELQLHDVGEFAVRRVELFEYEALAVRAVRFVEHLDVHFGTGLLACLNAEQGDDADEDDR